VPLTAVGKLRIVASADLGPLGARDGAPVEYNWVLPSATPQLLPWLAILALLMLKPNRRAAAWLIWLPLGCAVFFTLEQPVVLPAGLNPFWDAITALAFGLAAVWLVANYLRQSHRILTFLSVLLALAAFSALALVASQNVRSLNQIALATGIMLAVAALTTSVALSLHGLICHGRYHPLGHYLWPFLLLAGVWLAITGPFFLFVVIASGGNVPWNSWRGFFAPVFAMALATFATLLPFLILSSASPFFRERLQAIIHVKPAAPPLLNVPQLRAAEPRVPTPSPP
jgi:hypothetical protein